MSLWGNPLFLGIKTAWWHKRAIVVRRKQKITWQEVNKNSSLAASSSSKFSKSCRNCTNESFSKKVSGLKTIFLITTKVIRNENLKDSIQILFFIGASVWRKEESLWSHFHRFQFEETLLSYSQKKFIFFECFVCLSVFAEECFSFITIERLTSYQEILGSVEAFQCYKPQERERDSVVLSS